ncbi:hypothetical protein [Amycolatopsis sp. SID8362]|uniref:hypothetical protein n=1 Tax=Amycolatopsis sp. SID8362 TaxID=2690346 RepID=UPI00136F5623|nr:hypothetical protein [Amycolatopsis sp. SID8362]NBH09833.1 hypothetical protein [Amycolatopsis sp. SID8362]NED46526.1 hypothetical protein [Amycolatopsis sp. SID8362]
MLEEIDWGSLTHAYGPATDTPGHLAALTSADVDAQNAALDHLDAAVLHQGFPESATAPATRVVVRLLAQGSVSPRIRAALVEFVGWVAEATARSAGSAHFADHVVPLRQAITDAYPVVAGFLDDADPALRKQAVQAAVLCARTPELADRRAALADRLRRWAADPAEDRAQWVRRLGELGVDTGPYLADPDHDVRVCAALAPCVADHATATRTVIAALSDYGAADPRHYTLSELVAAALARAEDFELLAGPARTIIRHADWTGFDTTWGPLLLAAFNTPYDDRAELSATQRDILAAAVANDRLWDRRSGDSLLVFRRAGLPFDRAACARIAG